MSEKIECLKKIVEWFDENHSKDKELECWGWDCPETNFTKYVIPNCIVNAKRLIQFDIEKQKKK